MDDHEVLAIRVRLARRPLITHRKPSVEETVLRAYQSRVRPRKLQAVVCRARREEASVAGLNDKMKGLQHRLGTFTSMAIWEVRVKGIKALRSALGDRSLPLGLKSPT